MQEPILSCNEITEETCYDDEGWKPTSCAKFSDGGCPCPEGEEKCVPASAEGYPGWCQPATEACCDLSEVFCYDEKGATFCAKSYEGCPCHEGEEKCGGFCQPATETCCDESEDFCVGEDGATFCAKSSEGCPCHEGEQKCVYFEGEPGLCVPTGECHGQTRFVQKQNKLLGIAIKQGTWKEVTTLNRPKEKLDRDAGMVSKHSLRHNLVTLIRSMKSHQANMEEKKSLLRGAVYSM